MPHDVRIEEGKRGKAPGEAEAGDWRELVDMVADDISRIDLAHAWRPFSSLECGRPEGPPLSRVGPHTGR